MAYLYCSLFDGMYCAVLFFLPYNEALYTPPPPHTHTNKQTNTTSNRYVLGGSLPLYSNIVKLAPQSRFDGMKATIVYCSSSTPTR